ncbi:MAG: WD40 repeat domain-containing protein [Chloroflexota bacterium]
MKQSQWFLSIILIMVSSLVLDACSYSVQVLSTPSFAPPTVTLMSASASQTPVPSPTAFVSATPTLISIRADTLSMLENVQTFEMGDTVRSVAFTPDGTVLAAAGGNTGDFAIHLWNIVDNQIVGILGGHSGIIWDVAFSPDGQMLASVSSDGQARVWDWRTGDVLKIWNFPGQVVSVGFSPDGQTLAVGGVDESKNQVQNAAVWTFAVGSWSPIFKLPEYLDVTALAYSPDSRWLVGGGTSRNVQVWHTDSGTSQFTLSHAHQVSQVDISPDSSTVAAATCLTVVSNECTEGGVWLWNLPTGKLMKQKLTGFPNVVESLAFAADGSALIVGSRDGTLRIYDTADYQPRFETIAPGGISTLAVSPEGGWFATGNTNGEVSLWKIVYHP